MTQRIIRTGLIIRVGVIRVWWEVIGRAGRLRSGWQRPRSGSNRCSRSRLNWCTGGEYSRSILNCWTREGNRGRRWTLGEGEISLVKVSSLSNHCLLGGWVVELPALVSLRIANEYTLLHVRSEAGSLVLLHMHIGSAPPYTKVGDVRLSPIPQFIRCSASDSVCRAPVPHMDECSKTFTPERLRKPRLVQHSGETLRQHPIGSLSDPILLRTSSDSVLPLDATLSGKVKESIAHILSSLVIPQDLDFPLGLVLSIGLELLERLEDV
jgi:hypothetical protein